MINDDIKSVIAANANESDTMGKRFVFVKSVPRVSAQGRHLHTTREGRIMEKTKAKGAATYFTPSVSVKHNQLNTGFWRKIKNPYKTDKPSTIKLPAGWDNSDVWKKDEITIQEYLEIKYGHPPGFLTSEKPNMFDRRGQKATYMQSFIYPLKDGVNILDQDNMRDEIAYICFLQSNKIANSKEEANPIIHSHYISEVNENTQEKARKAERLEAAMAKLYELKTKYDSDSVVKFAIVLGVTKGGISPEAVKVKLSDFINNTTKSEENIDKFNEIYTMFTGNKNDKYRFDTYHLLNRLVDAKIVYAERGKYTWPNAPSPSLQTIGLSEEHTIEWLMEKESQEWRNRLTEELKAKTGTIAN